MNKGAFLVLILFLGGIAFSGCEKCMTCEINYTLANGERVTETSPQKCGFQQELDDKEKELEEAYSAYDSVEVDCTEDI